MSQKDRLQKRKEQYEKLYAQFGNIKNNDPFADEKRKVREALHGLNEQIAAFTMVNREGELQNQPEEKKLTMEEMDTLINQYSHVMKSMDDLMKKVNDRKKSLIKIQDNHEKGFSKGLSKAEKKELKWMQNESSQYDKIADTLGKDIKAVKEARQAENSLSMHELYETSRVNSSCKVKEGQELKMDAGAQNVRLAIKIIDAHNNEVEGYFTEDHAENLTEEEERKKAFEEDKKRFGSAADFITYDKMSAILEEYHGRYSQVLEDLMDGEVLEMGYDEAIQHLSSNMKNPKHNMRKLLNTPEKLRVFCSMGKKQADIENKYAISTGLGASLKGRINRRNAAMSGMAHLLGCENVLAHSENIKLTINGEEKKGTFMKKADGEDLGKITMDSDILDVIPQRANSLNLKKQVANLQILDYICGNPDRHGGNMLYKCEKDENGLVYLTGIQGIDNDTSFGKNDLFAMGMSEIKLEDMKVITKDMADQVLALNRETLTQMFYGYELEGEEIDNMVKRVEALQNKIREDDKVYAQGYGKGTLLKDKIKIVDDEEMGDLSLEHELAHQRGKNLFNKVFSMSKGSELVDEVIKNYNTNYLKSVNTYTDGKMMDFVNSMEAIGADDKALQTGSPQYTAMRKSTKDVLEAMRKYAGPAIQKENDQEKISPGLLAIQEKIDKAITACEAYQTYKHERNQREHKQDFDPAPHKLTRAERRWQNVDKNLKLLREQKALFEKMKQELAKKEEAERNRQTVIDQKIDAEEKTKVPQESKEQLTDRRAYDNYRSRTVYMMAQQAELLKNAKQEQNIAAIAEQQMQWNIKIGYAVMAFQPEERKALRDEIEQLTGIKSELSDEQLFKRAVACEMVDKKLKITMAEKNGPLSPEDTIFKQKLQDIRLEDNPDGYSGLMKTEEFESHFKQIKQRFDLESKENSYFKRQAKDKKVNEMMIGALVHVGVEKVSLANDKLRFSTMAKDFRDQVLIIAHVREKEERQRQEELEERRRNGELPEENERDSNVSEKEDEKERNSDVSEKSNNEKERTSILSM